ncbi:MAG: hypothetical protein KBT29_10960, partial [Prevotellaceae bacterium]|nr:hypothetical protein [Candidatus Minthosoma caballi]
MLIILRPKLIMAIKGLSNRRSSESRAKLALTLPSRVCGSRKPNYVIVAIAHRSKAYRHRYEVLCQWARKNIFEKRRFLDALVLTIQELRNFKQSVK